MISSDDPHQPLNHVDLPAAPRTLQRMPQSSHPAKRLTIAIDYDDTFTADRALWGHFINVARHHGHRVVVVTCRDASCEEADDMIASLDDQTPLIFTGGRGKRECLRDVLCMEVDIWIDDRPETILHGI